MLLGMTQVIFEGVPTYPDASRAWAITDKYKVPRTSLLHGLYKQHAYTVIQFQHAVSST